MIRRIATYLVAICVGVLLLAAWFFYGDGLSEGTAYRLALDEAQKYARENQLDLAHYTSPTMTGAKSKLYEFAWTPKEGRELSQPPLTILVEPNRVVVKVFDGPSLQPGRSNGLGESREH